MVKVIIFTLTVIGLVVGCKESDSENWTKESFILQDSTLQIEVNIPADLDSFYTWVDYNDTHCGIFRKYRFSSSKQPIFQESGFWHDPYPDSTYRITFSHHYHHADCYGIWTVDLDTLAAEYKNSAEMDSIDFKIYSARRVKINGILFDILTFRTDLVPRQKYQSTLIWGFAKVDSVDLEVVYECAMKNCDSFVDRMNESLESILVRKSN